MYPEKFSFANLANIQFLEGLYQSYLADPQTVDSTWRLFFDGMEFASAGRFVPVEKGSESGDLKIFHLIETYRKWGHLAANFNPLQPENPPVPDVLDITKLGFKPEDLKSEFPTCGFLPRPKALLSEILDSLKATYCSTVGFEYMDLDCPELQTWLQSKIEPGFDLRLSVEDKKYIQESLNKADLFENFLHTKYVGQKRFSLEGGETLIPIMAFLLDQGSKLGVKEVVVGMAHRGRLNVLANILNKSYEQIFTEFEDYYTPELSESTGDVKYHKGFSGALTTRGGKSVEVRLAANPSHLESVDPVVEGMVRARQQFMPDKEKKLEVVPILIHGDAAVAGQGVVYETLQFCRLNGYSTGGTIHVVVNNQIGFTTLPKDARSTRYCTDIAKSFGAPVFHVNAENPEECVAIARIAIELRQKFACDVFIDLNCYRKYGHNEGDEPTFTQPQQYQAIRQKRPIRELFKEQLIREGVMTVEEAGRVVDEFKSNLQKALESAKNFSAPEKSTSSAPAAKEEMFAKLSTAVPLETLVTIITKTSTVPQGFSLHPKIQKMMIERLKSVQDNSERAVIDWSLGELLAYGSILWDGKHVRLSGQDSRRGTFTHRHAVWLDQNNAFRYFPLSHIKTGQGLFDAYNSPLSEYAVMGFEFGYSLIKDDALIIWEAQFGDFVNGAQILIDQYISASEQKWGQNSPLVLKLPHGYEGQGPEHSSARIERFLQMCADDNFFVVNCTNPAQLFHVLRRQVLRTLKKPLIIFTPKALLRHPENVSTLADFTQGTFQEILDDPAAPAKPKAILLCSGKVYYDLVQERAKGGHAAAIIRIEQLYPLHKQRLLEVFQKYSSAAMCIWVQEEQSNMGAWEYMHPQLDELIKGKIPLRYAGRNRAASPAVGSHAMHKKQHEQLMRDAFQF